MKILSGRDLSKQLEEKYIDEIKHLQAKGINPVLNIIQVGNNQASNVYIANKVKLSKRLNFQCNHIKYDEKISNEELIQNIKKFNNDDSVHGILVQLPLPKHLNESLVIEAIDPNKDVDCFSNTNVGKIWTEKRDVSKLLKPCTPFGVITLLKSNHIPISGKNVVIINRSKLSPMYIDGKLQLPKSVVITIDDGPKTEIAVDMLTEYKMYATIFLVTSWFNEDEYYKTEYIEFHSHTHNMHDGGKCPGGQGGAIKCLDEELIQEDLRQSREDLDGSTVFCFPFYEYNDYAIEMLKEAGFTMAFIGESNYSDNLVHVGDDKFKLRRFVIVTYTTINDLENYFGQIS